LGEHVIRDGQLLPLRGNAVLRACDDVLVLAEPDRRAQGRPVRGPFTRRLTALGSIRGGGMPAVTMTRAPQAWSWVGRADRHPRRAAV